MAAIFSSQDVKNLLYDKFVVVIGDSIQRGIYKDLVRILQTDRNLEEYHLKQKGEKQFLTDVLVEGGQFGEMSNGKDYREVRQYQTDHHLVRFYIVTRCYGEYMETIMADLMKEPRPDVLIMNSCLWDVSRYGPLRPAMQEYKKNLQYLCFRMHEVLPKDCLFIWNTTMPVGSRIMGGFLIDDLSWMENYLTFLIHEANHYSIQVMESYNVDINDLHHHFRDPLLQLEHRVKDGIHWDPRAHRTITHFILRHICRAWGVPVFESGCFMDIRDFCNSISHRQNTFSKHGGGGRRSALNLKAIEHKVINGGVEKRRKHVRSNTHDGQRTLPRPADAGDKVAKELMLAFESFLTSCQDKVMAIERDMGEGATLHQKEHIKTLESIQKECKMQDEMLKKAPKCIKRTSAMDRLKDIRRFTDLILHQLANPAPSTKDGKEDDDSQGVDVNNNETPSATPSLSSGSVSLGNSPSTPDIITANTSSPVMYRDELLLNIKIVTKEEKDSVKRRVNSISNTRDLKVEKESTPPPEDRCGERIPVHSSPSATWRPNQGTVIAPNPYKLDNRANCHAIPPYVNRQSFVPNQNSPPVPTTFYPQQRPTTTFERVYSNAKMPLVEPVVRPHVNPNVFRNNQYMWEPYQQTESQYGVARGQPHFQPRGNPYQQNQQNQQNQHYNNNYQQQNNNYQQQQQHWVNYGMGMQPPPQRY